MRCKRIIISVVSDLETDQRVHKVASFFEKEGFDVLVIGRKLKRSGKLSRSYSTKRMRMLCSGGFLFYTEFNIRLFFLLLFSSFDCLWSNDTDTLLPNFWVSKIRHKRLCFDAHELFPQLPELIHRPCIQYFWERIENCIFPKLTCAFTVCQSIADYYEKRYGIKMTVLRNVPEQKDLTQYVPILDFPGKNIILYQGAVNVGRGLEQAIEAMSLLENAVLVIVGDGDVLPQLQRQVIESNLSDKVVFTGRVPLEELPRYTISAKVGLALLEQEGLSYYYALPNRIFDFIQAGIPILATDFPEMARVVKEYQVGKTIAENRPEMIAKAIREMLSQNYSKENFAKAASDFCWDNEQQKIKKQLRAYGLFE